jgi:methylated-DNA-[protein]-cysteine S-methyltransferase
LLSYTLYFAENRCGAVVAGEGGLVEVYLPHEQDAGRLSLSLQRKYSGILCGSEGTEVAARLLTRYFKGEIISFDLQVDLTRCTEFQKLVYSKVMEIPYGEVATYGEIARRVGSFGAARGVGSAMARNSLPIIIPCHRVVAANGRIGGFSGGDGILTKQKLLIMEGITSY